MQRYMNRSIQLITGMIGLLCILIIVGCGGGTEVGNPTLPSGNNTLYLQNFSSNTELEGYLKDQYATNILSTNVYSAAVNETERFYDIASSEGTGDGDQSTADSTNDMQIGSDFSQTNIQEAGVDEADVVKTDGTYLYAAGTSCVTISKVFPPDEMAVVNSIDVNGSVDELYLYDDILAILFFPMGEYGKRWSGTDMEVMDLAIGFPYWIPVKVQTGVMLVDVSDPSQPDILNTVKLDGHLVSSRLVDGKLHIVQQFIPDLPPISLYYDGSEEDKERVIQSNREKLDALTLGDILPAYEIVDTQDNKVDGGQLIAAQDFYRPSEPGGGSIVAVVSFDLTAPLSYHESVGIVADAHTIYASTQSLYVCSTLWNRELSAIGDYDEPQQTAIYQFDITGDQVVSNASGRIPGRILNQFSLGEYDNILRVATTTGSMWFGSSGLSHHVYCLASSEGKLEIVGELNDIAPGEDLYAARFAGLHGFLVTFVNVDPLFTLDLSDPTDPKMVGELKVPGYSDYIHPLDENHLLTIGKDTKEVDGFPWYQGVQLSVFNISDFADPQLLHKQIIGNRGTASQALYNHKAFTFWPEYGLLAIPISLYEYANEPAYAWEYGDYTFNGLYVYRISTDSGFEFLGRISTGFYNYGWTRGVFIEDHVYAVNDQAVRSAEIDHIEYSIQTIEFAE